MRALMSMFEEKKEAPPPPKKERFQSGLDAPRPELTKEAKSARAKSISKAEAEAAKDIKPKRFIPQIDPTDSDEERELKRKIQAKEQEILDLASKLTTMAERLDRVVETFHASIIDTETAEDTEPNHSEARTKAFTKAEVKEEEDEKDEKAAQRKSAPQGGTSLEAILAAARGGKPRAKSETPKYSKLLRDLK